MTKSTRLPAAPATLSPESGCPFRWRNGCPAAPPSPAGNIGGSEARYIQVRRQGIYLAACIVDDVAALDMASPQAVIEEIRRRICELVRCELQAAGVQETGYCQPITS